MFNSSIWDPNGVINQKHRMGWRWTAEKFRRQCIPGGVQWSLFFLFFVIFQGFRRFRWWNFFSNNRIFIRETAGFSAMVLGLAETPNPGLVLHRVRFDGHHSECRIHQSRRKKTSNVISIVHVFVVFRHINAKHQNCRSFGGNKSDNQKHESVAINVIKERIVDRRFAINFFADFLSQTCNENDQRQQIAGKGGDQRNSTTQTTMNSPKFMIFLRTN